MLLLHLLFSKLFSVYQPRRQHLFLLKIWFSAAHLSDAILLRHYYNEGVFSYPKTIPNGNMLNPCKFKMASPSTILDTLYNKLRSAAVH